MSSHSRMSKGGKKASACWGVSSISVRYSFWASGRASLYTLSPPMMNISSSSLQCDRASCKLLNVSAPGKTAALFLLSTILRRLGNAPLGKDSNVLRPMMMVCPVVSALKRFRSSGSRYSKRFSKPMARLRAIATITDIMSGWLEGYTETAPAMCGQGL